MISTYRNPALRQLSEQQVRYAPVDKRVEQMDRAETLLAKVREDSVYDYPRLCEEITGYRPQKYPDLKIEGEDLQHDLRMFVEDLSSSVSLPVEEAGEPVITVDQLSKKFNVSTKTVDRWRKRGLVSRTFRFGNRKRIGFLKSSVDRFVRQHQDEISRGTQFTQLSDSEREELILRARQLAKYGANPSEIARRLSRSFKRSPETIRYTLKQYDSAHPENAVFPTATSPLNTDRRREIYDRFKQGISADALAEEYGRTRTSIYRIASEVRTELLLEQPVDFMDSEDFRAANAERIILAEPPANENKAGKIKPPPGLPPYLASLYAVPLLSKDEEVHWFRRFNFLKFKARQLQNLIDRKRPRTKQLDELERLLELAQEAKNFLIRSNLRLVVSIAKKHMTATSNFFEMVSDGNMSLMRAIEKFDYTKGNKFSTYATWAIMKNYARSIPAEHTLLDRFRTGNEEVFMFSPDGRGSQYEDEAVNARQHELIMTVLDQLDEREKSILMHRYGLEKGSEPETLEQVGVRFGVTKERIRQIETRALQKVRKKILDEKPDIPGF